MTQLFANNAYGSLGATLASGDTILTLAAGQGERFPSPTGGDFFLLTLVGLDSNDNENAWEIVKVTGRSTDALMIQRAQEGTTAATWVAGTRAELRLTSGTLESLVERGILTALDINAALLNRSNVIDPASGHPVWISVDSSTYSDAAMSARFAYNGVVDVTFTGSPAYGGYLRITLGNGSYFEVIV